MSKKEKYNKEDLKLVLEKLYKCRDLEISNLWQRSVFLSVFLILCFTTYGYLSIDLLSNKKLDISFLNHNIASMVLASISIIFSIIWILMAKSSKAWYEVYENAISKFEYKHFKKLGMPSENIMGEMTFSQENRSDNIFSTKGGAYSPSKINIAIGQISLVFWIILILVHLTATLVSVLNQCSNYTYLVVAILISILTLFIGLYIVRSKYLKSGFLTH